MAGRVLCPTCGSKLPLNAPRGLCPACLLRQGMDSDDLDLALTSPGEYETTDPTNLGTSIAGEKTFHFVEPTVAGHSIGSPGSDGRTVLLNTTAKGRSDGGEGSPVAGTEVAYFGNYLLLRELGRGGMGIVHEARQISLNRIVAIKMLKSDVLAGDEELRRFQNEAEAVAQLDHPNIVPVLEVGEHDGRRYFSMKCIDGRSLEGHIAEFRDKPEAAARLVRTIADAVQHAHRRGILHRDLKPSNILVDATGEPFVVDFGLARRLVGDADLTLSGAILGTPGYMSPEQATGRRSAVTTSCDVYGLGAILYALMTGHAPFEGHSVLETLQQVRDSSPRPPRAWNPRIPIELQVICQKAMDKLPSRRYSSAEALADELGLYLAGEPITGRPVGAIEKAIRWSRRRPALAAMIALVVGLTLISLAVVGSQLRETRKALEAAEEAEKRADRARRAESEQRLRAEVYAYPGNVALAARELSVGNADRVVDLLDRCPPRLRGWEWDYLSNQVADRPLTFRGHSASVLSLAFGPDERRVASADDEGKVLIWDPSDGRVLARCDAHEGPVMEMAFRPDGRELATAGRDSTVRVWDPADGRLVRTLRGHRSVVATLAYSPDGNRLASGGWDGLVIVWNTSDGHASRVIGEVPGWVTRVSFATAGNYLAASTWRAETPMGGSAELRVWEAGTGRVVLSESRPSREPYVASFEAAETPPDARKPVVDREAARDVGVLTEKALAAQRLATGRGPTRAEGLGLWDFPHGPNIYQGVLPGSIALRHSPDQFRRLIGHTDWISALKFDSSGRRLASSSLDGTVRIWDVSGSFGRGDRYLTGLSGKVLAVAASPDGRLVAGLTEGQVRVWDRESGGSLMTSVARSEAPMRPRLAFPDGRHLIGPGPDGVLSRWEISTGLIATRYEGELGYRNQIELSPDGRTLAAASGRAVVGKNGEATPDECVVRLFDVPSGRILHSLAVSRWLILDLAFSPDGRLLATAGGRGDPRGLALETPGELKFWDVARGQLFRELSVPPGYIMSLSFHPGGRQLASGGRDGMIRLWDAVGGRQVRLLRGHSSRVDQLAYTPDGSLLISGGGEMLVRGWDVATGRERAAIRGLDRPRDWTPGESFAMSPDGRIIASIVGNRSDTSKFARLVVHAVEDGRQLLEVAVENGPVTKLAFGSDGRQILTGHADGTVRFWQASPD